MLSLEKEEELEEEELFDGIHLKEKEEWNNVFQYIIANQNMGSRLSNQELHKIEKNIS
ncbi:hypothetical protein [Listeria cornellensis]|uniref:hypothetical protein n=1 Tax=Listeria cornellensis TaxID=1494961 RepID=UPI0004B3D0EC|nr:hypothetical protein [Listeria cornellensis]